MYRINHNWLFQVNWRRWFFGVMKFVQGGGGIYFGPLALWKIREGVLEDE